MATRSLAQKLAIRAGHAVATINAPVELAKLPAELPPDARLGATLDEADVVLLYVRDRAQLTREWSSLAPALKNGATLWIAYPKRSGTIETDLTRDRGWEPVAEAGFDAVSQVAIDDTWSALRFRHAPDLRAEREARGAFGPGRRPAG